MYNVLIGQSGGPTAVINASLYGAAKEALDTKKVDIVYGMIHGIEGFLEGKVLNISEYAKENKIEYWKNAPASFLGSCRFKLPADLKDPVYPRLFELFQEMSIKMFLYIGGNDSMDTVSKLSSYAKIHNSEIRFIGVPKTVDNDLVYTDHTPGFGSIAKYVASTVREIILDASVYDKPVVTIVELMGRHAGWVTAASVLARTEYNRNPLLIYLPEGDFEMDTFLADIKEALKVQNSVVVCVSEGISDKDGKFICEYGTEATVDGFGHKMLAGCGKVLEQIIRQEIGCKARAIELNLPQRCSAILASATDIAEAELAGRFAVQSALEGYTGMMAAFERGAGNGLEGYQISMKLVDVSQVCNKEKKFPSEWIISGGTDISDEFISYALPLIQGESNVPFENGLPKYPKPAFLLKE